jgi:hypothetical protein
MDEYAAMARIHAPVGLGARRGGRGGDGNLFSYHPGRIHMYGSADEYYSDPYATRPSDNPTIAPTPAAVMDEYAAMTHIHAPAGLSAGIDHRCPPCINCSTVLDVDTTWRICITLKANVGSMLSLCNHARSLKT